MSIIAILSWWYGGGWISRIDLGRKRLVSTLDFFSIDQLLGSLFAPFRQNGTLTGGSWLMRLGDQLVSRAIGGVIRIGMVIAGLLSILFWIIWTIIEIIIWPLIPFFPILGAVVWKVGWVI